MREQYCRIDPDPMFIKRIHLLALLVAVLVLAGCAARRPADGPRAAPASAQQVTAMLAIGLPRIEAASREMDALDQEFSALHRAGGWRKRGFFDAAEVNEIEWLLFRFVSLHSMLWDLVNAHSELLDAGVEDRDAEMRARVLSMTAELLLVDHTAFLVTEFASDPIAIAQINQAYYRSEIPFGTYDRLRDNVTAPNTEQALASLSGPLSTGPNSALGRLAASDPDYRVLIEQLPALHAQATRRLRAVAAIAPSHSEAEADARRDSRDRHQVLYAFQSVLFKDVSRLKNPTAHLIKFSDAQKSQIYDLLQPGDVILTYTAGYVSDVFIPGAFKHGITFVGARERTDLLEASAAVAPDAARYERSRLATDLQRTALADGKPADVIEAVAEGVIFNNLAHLLDTHINRLLVLRPQLSDSERAAFVVGVFSYLGDGYDFRFDFANASQQVCTELIYRALNNKGSIDFRLTERAGRETLSADDIAKYHLNAAGTFELVLYAEENPGSKDHQAMILTGADATRRLRALMAE